MSLNWGGNTWELMLTKRPSDTHFSQSRASGGKSALVRGDENDLSTHAVLFDVESKVLVVAAAGILLKVAAPYLKKGAVVLKSKLSRETQAFCGDTPGPRTSFVEAEAGQSSDFDGELIDN